MRLQMKMQKIIGENDDDYSDIDDERFCTVEALGMEPATFPSDNPLDRNISEMCIKNIALQMCVHINCVNKRW